MKNIKPGNYFMNDTSLSYNYFKFFMESGGTDRSTPMIF